MQQNEMVGKVMDELKRKGMYSVNHVVRPTRSTPYAPYALPPVSQRVVPLRAAGFGLPVAPKGLGVSGKCQQLTLTRRCRVPARGAE